LEWGPDEARDAGVSVGRALLTPTRIYVKSILSALNAHGSAIKGVGVAQAGTLDDLPDEGVAVGVGAGRGESEKDIALMRASPSAVPSSPLPESTSSPFSAH
jgi:hypothetical protein